MSLAATVTVTLLALAANADWFGWIGELVSTMGWRLTALGLLTTGVQLLARHRRYALATFAASSIALGPSLVFSPRAQSETTANSVPLRLLVANVHALNDTPDSLLSMLTESDAEVLILAEPPPQVMRELRPDGMLARSYPHVVRSKPNRGTHAWLVVASRLPLTQAPGTVPGINPVVITVQGHSVAIIATHLISPRSPTRYRQAQQQISIVASLAQEFNDQNMPLILAGDLNSPPGSHLSRSLTEKTGTQRAKPITTIAGSWPTVLPRWLALPIDGAMVSPGIKIEHWSLVDLPGSDHRGLKIDLIIPNADSDTQSRQSGSSPSNP